jgi:hypothetical protein
VFNGSPASIAAELAAHAATAGDCRGRRERQLEDFTINWDQWCVCGAKFTGTVGRNERAMAAHWVSGRCPHPTIGYVPIMVAGEPAIESKPFTAAVGDALAADGLISYRQVGPAATPATKDVLLAAGLISYDQAKALNWEDSAEWHEWWNCECGAEGRSVTSRARGIQLQGTRHATLAAHQKSGECPRNPGYTILPT